MRRQFTTRERIGVITESGFSAEGLKLSGSPRAMRALEELVSVLCDMVLGQREQIERVRALHGRHDPNCPYGEDCAAAGLCLACREEYPCATIRALDGSNSPPVTSEITGPLIDPDCRDGKHSSCVGGPCECVCHES